MANRKIPLSQRFWNKVDKSPGHGPQGECWTWAAFRRDNYGVINVDGTARQAHRIAWELTNNTKIPTDMDACHRCDNPPCVRPSHIFIGTPAENNQDRHAKGRTDIDTARKIRTAQQRNQTHCKWGHELTPQNIYTPPGRHRRICRQCVKDRHHSPKL